VLGELLCNLPARPEFGSEWQFMTAGLTLKGWKEAQISELP
jgi:hypothetical protein